MLNCCAIVVFFVFYARAVAVTANNEQDNDRVKEIVPNVHFTQQQKLGNATDAVVAHDLDDTYGSGHSQSEETVEESSSNLGLQAHQTDWGYYYDNELWYPEPDHPQNGSIAPQCHYKTVPLNHFGNSPQKEKFQICYCCNRQFYMHGGPLLFMIGGNHAINKGFLMTGLGYDVAEYTKGALCFIEHRYYGNSIPFKNLTTENLSYLTIEQALEDIIGTIGEIKENFQHSGKVGVIGCNYGGRLAAYLRLKFPTVVHAAYASCAPLQAKLIFNEGFEPFQNSLSLTSPDCLQVVQKAVKKIEEKLETEKGRKYIQKIFNTCGPLEKDGPLRENFFSNLAYWLSFAVRQSSPGRVCKECESMLSRKGKPLQKLAGYFRTKLGKYCMTTYKEDIERANSLKPEPTNSRQRNYQMCAQLGYIRGAVGENQPFGNNVSPSLGYQYCQDSFGDDFTQELIDERMNRVNLIYGGNKPKVTKVVFVYSTADGSYILGYKGKNKYNRVSDIKGEKLCGDMYTIKDGEIDSVIETKVKAKHAFINYLLH